MPNPAPFSGKQEKNRYEEKIFGKAHASHMAAVLLEYLEELKEACAADEDGFAYGEKTAYIECLELLALWKGAEDAMGGEEIEKRYPL